MSFCYLLMIFIIFIFCRYSLFGKEIDMYKRDSPPLSTCFFIIHQRHITNRGVSYCILIFVVITKGCMELGQHKRADCPHWSYEGDLDGPSAWGDLCSSYATCKTGTISSLSPSLLSFSPLLSLTLSHSHFASSHSRSFTPHSHTFIPHSHSSFDTFGYVLMKTIRYSAEPH